MDIGIVYPQTELGGDPEAVRQIGRWAEESGIDYLLAYDHVLGADHADREPALTGPYTLDDPFHDPFVLFAYLAGMTERLEFISGVLVLPQRQTALVAKQAADLSLLSDGRFRLGVGVGWNHVEYTALGQDFSTRGARADEQIELLRALWRDEVVTFDGRFDTVERANLNPRPTSPIPVWIGGFSEPAYRRAAEAGDGFCFVGDPERSWATVERIRSVMADAGRGNDPFGTELQIWDAEVDAAVAKLARWRELGGSHGCIHSMGKGLDSVDAHLDHFGRVATAISRTG
ncbi:MAG: LLM class F420-dependent oxidoreductase [Acidimicrobiia bacterium]|nr:LLM class F420-dependent oxidoreductase [Acidimicrobiia bacterium]